MKVGILTFHRAENFGAALQVYALQSFLQKKGCDVDVIDYRNLAIESMYDIYIIPGFCLLGRISSYRYVCI